MISNTAARAVTVAIDGPDSAPRSTIARVIAAKLGFTYIDSIAMYRAIAFWALREGIDVNDDHKMEQLARAAEIGLDPAGRELRLNHEDISGRIDVPEVCSAGSRLTAMPGVRRALIEKQRALASTTSVVMEGRNIGTVVFPSADVKIYLDAAALEPGEHPGRDDQTGMETLTQAPDAVYVDPSGLSLDELEQAVLRIVRERITNGKDFH